MVSIHSAPNQPGIAGKVLGLLGKNGINIEFITESCNIEGCADISFCFKSYHKEKVKQLLAELRRSVKFHGEKWFEEVAMIGIYGPHFREKPFIAGLLCSALGEGEVNILGISTSISTVSCIIDNDKIDEAKEAILTKFELPT
jgi:aspartokinase